MFNNTGNPKVPRMKEPTTLTIVKIQKDITGVWHMCKTGVNVLYVGPKIVYYVNINVLNYFTQSLLYVIKYRYHNSS